MLPKSTNGIGARVLARFIVRMVRSFETFRLPVVLKLKRRERRAPLAAVLFGEIQQLSSPTWGP